MILQKMWKNYSYVILLFVISFICGLIYIHTLSNSDQSLNRFNTQSSETNDSIVEMTSYYE
ncbi:hypothetical protein [Bacillus andreraoultii]|uniref:hypothetical protein n=1 Tax=Bacillus andreraoultii TaxID=1499685 RepID=UPI000AFB61FE|nr:hypothetical protein [Bacillus andreraoultii]